MAPAGAGLIDDSHGGVGPPPPAAKAAPPPASTPTPAKATAAAAVSASERILPLMKTPSTCESDEPAPSAPPRLSPPMRAHTVPWAVSVPAAPPSAGTWEPPVRLDRWHCGGHSDGSQEVTQVSGVVRQDWVAGSPPASAMSVLPAAVWKNGVAPPGLQNSACAQFSVLPGCHGVVEIWSVQR